MTSAPVSQPEFSIVCPIYNVEKYIEDFFRSVEAQTIPQEALQIIAVNDGSTDSSLQLLERWAENSELDITILTKPNGGLSSARNFGIEHAKGKWLTFADPDDLLAPDYFANLHDFIGKNPEAEIVQSRVIYYDESAHKTLDDHPRRSMFRNGDILVDIDEVIDLFPYSVATGLVKTGRVQELGLRFDERVKPSFEDGHFLARYLLACPTPYVGFVASATYSYRKRTDNSSLVQGSHQDPNRYLGMPKYGYLDLCNLALEKRAEVPRWIQEWILYDLYFFFKDEHNEERQTASKGEVAAEFLATLEQIRTHLDPNLIENSWHWNGKHHWRAALDHGVAFESWHTPYAVVGDPDEATGQVQLSYLFTGELPQETLIVGGDEHKPERAQSQAITFFEKDLIFERHLWVDISRPVSLMLNGVAVPFRNTYELKKNFWSDTKPRPNFASVSRPNGSSNWHTDFVVADQLDKERNQIRIRFKFTGKQPILELVPKHSPEFVLKQETRSLSDHGENEVFEKEILLRTDGPTAIKLAGKFVDFRSSYGTPEIMELNSEAVRGLTNANQSDSRITRLSNKLKNRLGRASRQ